MTAPITPNARARFVPDQIDPVVRRRARRTHALTAIVIAVVLLVGGAVLTGTGAHTIGIIALGYGIGVLVAGGFLLAGWEPGRGRK